MDAIRSVVKNGRIELATPPDWPEGCEVLIEPFAARPERIGLGESEWRDDPASLADWDAWLQSIEPLDFTAEEQAAFAEFDEKMRRFNIDAVRREMEKGPLP
jgi:hypothetical protein